MSTKRQAAAPAGSGAETTPATVSEAAGVILAEQLDLAADILAVNLLRLGLARAVSRAQAEARRAEAAVAQVPAAEAAVAHGAALLFGPGALVGRGPWLLGKKGGGQ